MVDIRSEKKEVVNNRRKNERLEFHCEAAVVGLMGKQIITDISLGGIFIETENADNVRIGQLITISTKLPTEREIIRFHARVVNKTKRGRGCRFISLEDRGREAICLCFEMFKDTLPVGCDQD